MARYMILILGDEKQWDAMTPEDSSTIEKGHLRFREVADSVGATILAAGELESSSTTTTLKAVGDDRPTVTDGPFLESKEALGGFYVVRAEDLDAVIAMASALHEVRGGHSAVEIRPLVDHGE
ncbi:YciI family protein [Microlunatus soli]|uniref:Uncharacterized conserved protein n=1 Tax=Microlunatus soli TaxID=630515 RepID=A0A1H1MNM3_9ACTN|nr:YciI family protein [Microlunatus soli]SDR87559.1 Uncharacterized conserved protein [Microlunatus soli]